MTEFEIDAIFNTICRPGQVVKILTKSGKEENIPIRVWKRWTIIKVYEHHVLMQSEKDLQQHRHKRDDQEGRNTMEITPERIENCKTCKYKYRDETQEPCAHCTKNAVDNYEPMTNGDYIRSLGDADLAPIIMCPSEVGFDEIGFDEIVCQMGKQHCIECTRRWLEAERKVEE